MHMQSTHRHRYLQDILQPNVRKESHHVILQIGKHFYCRTLPFVMLPLQMPKRKGT